MITIVRVALATAESTCRGEFATNWQCFVAHDLERRTFPAIGRELGLSDEGARTKARTVRRRVESAIRGLIVRDGVPEDEVDAEIRRLLAAVAS